MTSLRKKLAIALTLSFMTLSAFAAKGKVVVNVSVPGMSFQAISKKVKGKAVKKGDGFVAKNISVKVKTLKTEMDLRDEHLHKKVAGEDGKNPKIIIHEGKASGGKGKAKIEISGVTKVVDFTYAEKSGNFVAKFKLSLKSFGITGISYMGVGVQDEVTVEASIPIK